MNKNNKSFIELEVEKRIPIDVYFNRYIQPLKKGLTEISIASPRSCCPFHDERDPSFSWWQSKKKFHCFGCGVSGNIIRLHQLKCFHYEGRRISSNEALTELINMYQLLDLPTVAEKVEEAGKVNKIKQARERLVQTYQSGFTNDALTISRYEKMQRNIMNIQNIDERVRALNELDMMACLAVSRVVENE